LPRPEGLTREGQHAEEHLTGATPISREMKMPFWIERPLTGAPE
jgi:hypothetical protein